MRSENLKSIVATGSVGMAVLAERAGAFSSFSNGFFAKEGALLGGIAVGEWLRRRCEFDPLFDEIDGRVNHDKVAKAVVAGVGAWGMNHGMEPVVANAMLGAGVTSTIYPILRAPEKISTISSSVKESIAARKERRENKKKNKEED